MNADDIPADVVTLGSHALDAVAGDLPDGRHVAYYRCSCGARGRYVYPTDEEMHRAWRGHVARRMGDPS